MTIGAAYWHLHVISGRTQMNDVTSPAQEAFRQDLQAVLNKHSRENGSDTPDFLLADYLIECLQALDRAIRNRSGWYGRHDKPGTLYVDTTPKVEGE
jgi:hypothetical protein